MCRKYIYPMLTVCLALSLIGSGCKSRRGRRSRAENDIRGGVHGVDGVSDIEIIGSPLPDRPQPGEMSGEMSGGYSNSEFSPIFFSYDSAQIEETEREKIELAANRLRRFGRTSIIVEGHCDERGSREYNMALGERRALAVRAYLIGLGIDSQVIQTRSFGEEQPAAFGHDEESWQANRRCEIIRY